MSIVKKLKQADFHFLDTVDDIFPDDLRPELVTDDGVLIEYLHDNSEDALFAALGKVLVIQDFLEEKSLNTKYSVVLAMTLEQFKSLHKLARKSITKKVSIVILDN